MNMNNCDLKSLEDLYRYIGSDYKAGGWHEHSLLFEFMKGNSDNVFLFYYVIILRFTTYIANKFHYKNKTLWFVPYLLSKHFYQIVKHIYGIYIEPNCISEGLVIEHFGYIWIDHSSVIGKNCRVLPRVLMGKKHPGSKPPLIFVGDDCYIGTGSTILGPIKIGNNVTIAAGAVVVKDVPDNCVVGGNPAKIIKYKDINS